MLEGEGALVDEEAEAVIGFATGAARVGEKACFRWLVYGVVGAVMGEKVIGRDDFRIVGFESERTGLNDEIRLMAVGFQFGIVEGEGEDFGFRREMVESGGKRLDFIEAAVDEGQSGGFCEAALGGDGLSGTATGTEDEGVDFSGVDIERLFDRGDESGTIGVVSEGF